MTESSIIHNRLRKNLKQRKAILKYTNAYRLYEKDIPEFPFIIDVYSEYAVIYEKGRKLDADDKELLNTVMKHQGMIISAVKDVLKIPEEKVIFKKREKKKGIDQYERMSSEENFTEVKEGSLKFRCNLYDYLDSGLFLDHRPLRKIIFDQAEGKSVMNLFAYTGSISVFAAAAGARVTTIDMSKTYLNWAKENFKINNINPDKHTFIQADVIKMLDQPLGKKYDIIILDPPSFSNSKRMEDIFEVQKDHAKLVHNLMDSLTPTGKLYFSNNFRKFKLDEEISNKFYVKDITLKSIPKDFRDLKIHTCFEITRK